MKKKKNDILEKTVAIADDTFKKAEKLGVILQDEYIYTLEEMQKSIADFYRKYAKETGMTYQDAVKYLSNVELKPFRHKIKKYTQLINNGDLGLLERLRALDTKEKITRLESLIAEINIELYKLTSANENALTEHLTELCKNTYEGVANILEGNPHLKTSFGKLNTSLINETININFPWSGESFSEALWGNTQKLSREVKRELVRGFTRGSTVPKMASNLSKTMERSYKDALRVVRTESAYVLNKTSLQSYSDSGVVTAVEFLAVLDGNTSALCFNLNGDVILLDKAVPGENIPPLHPNCRSTTIPVIDDTEEYVGKIDMDPKNVNKALVKYEDRIYNQPIEYAYTILPDGNVYKITGNTSEVHPENMGLGLKGAIITHNHPANSSEGGFSKDDIRFFSESKLKELRLVDKDFRYSLSGTTGDIDTYKKAIKNVWNTYDVDELDDRQTLLHIYAEEFAKLTGARYTRKERK